MLPHYDQQASDDQNPTEHAQMLSSSTFLLNLILRVDVTFSRPPGAYTHNSGSRTLASAAVVEWLMAVQQLGFRL